MSYGLFTLGLFRLILHVSVVMICAILSFVDMIRVITARSYSHVNPSPYYVKEHLSKQKDTLAAELINDYLSATRKNDAVNTQWAKLYNRAWWLCAASLILFSVKTALFG